jgi:tRNA 2-thiouridine synthesizing protein A
MAHTLDVRGLRCPVPLLRARAALPGLGPGETLVVLATDPEAPIDLAALAADHDLAFSARKSRGEWRMELRSGGPGSPGG